MTGRDDIPDTTRAAMWCNECRRVRNADGTWPERPSSWAFTRCGRDYGPELHSHLDVVMLAPVSVSGGGQ